MAVYTNDLRLKEIATGDESGTWGASTNTNLELIAEAFSFGTEAITTNADTHTTTISDGTSDPGRSIFLKYTGTLDSACTITIGPNTVSKLWFIENATSGSQNIIIKQGSGATVTIANGQTKAIYSDGAGSGGAMVDAFTDLAMPSLFVEGATTITVSDNSSALTLVSTDADANSGPVLSLYRNSASPADSDVGGQIEFHAENDADEKITYATIRIKTADVSDGTEDGTLAIQTITAGSNRNRFNIQASETVINEDSRDLDFRVESDGNANMLVVNAGDDRVGVGTASPADVLEIEGSIDGSVSMVVTNNSSGTSAYAGIKLDGDGNNFFIKNWGDNVSGLANTTQFISTASGSNFLFSTASTEAMRIDSSQRVGIGGTPSKQLHIQNANDAELLIESTGSDATDDAKLELKTTNGEFVIQNDRSLGVSGALTFAGSSSNILVLDHANSLVGLGTASPQSLLHLSATSPTISMTDTNSMSDTNDRFIVRASSDQGNIQYFDNSASATRTLMSFLLTEVNVNDDAADRDFRIESNTNANMFGINGGSDFVYIGADEQVQGGTLSINAVSASPVIGMLSRSTTDGHQATILLQQTNATSGNFTATGDGRGLGLIGFRGVDSAGTAREGAGISVEQDGSAVSGAINGKMTFRTRDVDRMQITSGGIITMGGSSHNDDVLYLTRGDSGKALRIFEDSTEVGFIGTNTATGLSFTNLFSANSGVGTKLHQLASGAGNADVRFNSSTAAITFDTSSRLVKEDIEDIPYGLEAIKKLSPKKYKRTDGEKEVELGLIADEVVEVIPEIVGIMSKSVFTKEESDTEEIPGSVRYSKLTAVLVKAIQEQQEMIETLQTKVAALEGGS